jgi:hypothetical protein
LSLQEYLTTVVQGNREVEKVTVLFDGTFAKYIRQSKYLYGYVSEEVVGTKVRMHFLSACFHSFGRWLLQFGNNVEIESPEKAKEVLTELVEELSAHHLRQPILP